ncbi:hypothetical protein ACS0TY_014037 [Phlomoides rotata]
MKGNADIYPSVIQPILTISSLHHKEKLLEEEKRLLEAKIGSSAPQEIAIKADGKPGRSDGELKLYKENEDDEANGHEMIKKERMKN